MNEMRHFDKNGQIAGEDDDLIEASLNKFIKIKQRFNCPHFFFFFFLKNKVYQTIISRK